jgi:putative ABC transport system permease protein
VTAGRLVWANLWRHPTRAALTGLFSLIALFLFVFLRSVVTTLESAVKDASSNRLAVQSAVSLFVQLPESYRARIESVPGVELVTPWTWFGGHYKDPSEFFAQFAADVDVLLKEYPEVVVDPKQKADLMANRQGALVGEQLLKEQGWKVGQRVPLVPHIYQLPGGASWDFDVAATYRTTRQSLDEKTMFFHDSYFRDVVRRSIGDVGIGASVYMVKVAPGHRAEDVAAAIDAVYDNGPQRTLTQTEAAFQAQFVSMMGNIPVFIGWIGGAVLFAIFFSVLNTSQMAARERARDVGILKALGFPDALGGRLLVAESMLLVGVGGALGIVLGLVTVPAFRGMFGTQIPNYWVAPGTVVLAFLVALGIGLLAGLFPALRLMRLRPVDVLREEG